MPGCEGEKIPPDGLAIVLARTKRLIPEQDGGNFNRRAFYLGDVGSCWLFVGT